MDEKYLSTKQMYEMRQKQIDLYLSRELYRPERFMLWELVPKEVYEEYSGNYKYLLRRFDKAFLITIDAVAHFSGSSCFVNTWKFKRTYLNEEFNYSGYRPENCKIGAKFSTHKDWNTCDLKFEKYRGTDINIIRNAIINYQAAFPFISIIEGEKLAPTWLHLSTSNYSLNGKIRII